MSEQRLKVNLLRRREGEAWEAIDAYYVLGRKPSGGMVARVVINESIDLLPDDVLVFDFTTEKVTRRLTSRETTDPA